MRPTMIPLKYTHNRFFTRPAFVLFFLLLSVISLKVLHAEFPSLIKSAKNKNNVHYVIQGVKGKIKKNIDARLSEFAKTYKNDSMTFSQYQSFIQEAPEQILKAMQPYGYYKPVIKSELINAGKSSMNAVFYITPSEQMRVTKFSVIIDGPGKDEAFFQAILKNFPLKQGDPLLIKKYNLGKQQLLDTATQEGYLKSQMQISRVRINLEKYTSDITIHFNTGKRFYFGPVSFNKTPYNEEYLRRYIPFEQGEPFAPGKVTTFQDYLSGTEQFKQISVAPQYNNAPNQSVPVLVELTPEPSQSYTFGAGYGTDTGVRGTVGWNLLRATPSGHKFQALIQASQLQDSVQGQYIIPGLHPTTEEYAITGTVFNLNYPGSKSNAAQLSAAYRTHESIFQTAYSMNALFEHYTIEEDPGQDAFIIYPSANWKMTKVDNPIFSKNGYSLSLTTQGSSEALASTVSFAQVQALGKWAKFIKPTRSRLYTRANVGITSVDNIDNLPPSLQFYTGGPLSVRGYSYQSLGPGKALIASSIEWQQEVIKNGYLTFFYDAGNAFNNTPIELMRSVGSGIMWVTPIGPLHLSFAKALDETPDNNAGAWHVVFSMGPDL